MKKLFIILLLPLSIYSQTDPVETCRPILHEIVNNYRVENGVGKLILDDSLTQLAQDWAKHMYDVDKLYHSPHKYPENILTYGRMPYSYIDGVEEYAVTILFNAWRHSPGHNENMLDYNHKKVGYGFYDGYYVQLFSNIL